VLRRLERRTKLSRRAAGPRAHEQVIAANFDTALLLTSLNQDLNPRRIERYLVPLWESGAKPVLVLTKADLASDAVSARRAVQEVAIGVPVHAISVKSSQGLEEILPYFAAGKTTLLIGSSGVGKSTLVNRLAGRDVQAVGEIRRVGGKGRHTTSFRRLLQLPGGALILDTPGMRELQLWSGEEGLLHAFEDLVALSSRCRYGDCRHESEPECAVRQAVRSGELSPERYRSFLKLLNESRRPAYRHRFQKGRKQERASGDWDWKSH
jgi:ribosome biogenesis GTPase